MKQDTSPTGDYFTVPGVNAIFFTSHDAQFRTQTEDQAWLEEKLGKKKYTDSTDPDVLRNKAKNLEQEAAKLRKRAERIEAEEEVDEKMQESLHNLGLDIWCRKHQLALTKKYPELFADTYHLILQFGEENKISLREVAGPPFYVSFEVTVTDPEQLQWIEDQFDLAIGLTEFGWPVEWFHNEGKKQ